MFAFIALSMPAKSQQGGQGGVEAYCAAVMYFAVGESTGAAKAQYQKIGVAYLNAGVKIAGQTKFVELYEVGKKIVNSSTDKDFKSAISSCTQMAPK